MCTFKLNFQISDDLKHYYFVQHGVKLSKSQELTLNISDLTETNREILIYACDDHNLYGSQDFQLFFKFHRFQFESFDYLKEIKKAYERKIKLEEAKHFKDQQHSLYKDIADRAGVELWFNDMFNHSKEKYDITYSYYFTAEHKGRRERFETEKNVYYSPNELKDWKEKQYNKFKAQVDSEIEEKEKEAREEEEKIKKLKVWARQSGSELLKERIAWNFDWKDLAVYEAAVSALPVNSYYLSDEIDKINSWKIDRPDAEMLKSLDDFLSETDKIINSWQLITIREDHEPGAENNYMEIELSVYSHTITLYKKIEGEEMDI